MFLVGKKVLYLSLFEGKESKSGAGFVKFTGKGQECRVDIQVNRSFCKKGGEYPLYFCLQGEEVFVRKLSVQAGGIIYNRSFKTEDNKIYIQGKLYDESDFEGIRIKIDSGSVIAGYLKEPQKRGDLEPTSNAEEIGQESMTRNREAEKEDRQNEEEKAVFATDMESKPREVCVFESKWDQLMNDYPQIHPFGDERVFISIEPKDFIILRASYQKLVNNSFLLHGFYNYRYLILGPDKEMGGGNGECFYLGVPGTYFEREKMVAVMFGFEGYECAGPVEIGKFGFYMRKVEL